MSVPLQEILDSELANGNKVTEISSWPPKCHLLVILKKPFHKSYLPSPNVEYLVVNDIRYWKAEYRYKGGKECLACGFG